MFGPRNYVKVEHLPTGMTAYADHERSLLKCKTTCISIVRGKLWHLEHGADETTATDAQRAIAARILERS